MSVLDQSKATTTNFTGGVPDFIVQQRALDNANPSDTETFWYFDNAQKYLGYAFNIPEIYSAASALCTWTVNRGWKSEDSEMTAQLKHIKGMGKDTFTQLMWNHEFIKLIVGDAFMEVKYNKSDKILNMIPISPERVRLVFGKSGMLKRYDVWNGTEFKPIPIERMLHSSNKRIGDQLHGTSQIEPAQKVIDARNEAFDDERVIKHRDKALGIAYYDTNNSVADSSLAA